MPNGVEVDLFAAGAARVTSRPSFAHTGTLAYQGIDLLAEAFAKARARRPGLKLRLRATAISPLTRRWRGGWGGGRAGAVAGAAGEPARAAGGSPPVAVLPRVDRPGLPQKLLNYMASGRAVVAFAGSAKRIEHEVTALVVPNHDTDAFAAAIPRLQADLGEAMRLEGGARLRGGDLLLGDRGRAPVSGSMPACSTPSAPPPSPAPARPRRSHPCRETRGGDGDVAPAPSIPRCGSAQPADLVPCLG
ncbi:MAG: glycosyltransferase [Geminicoccaceae bacterium]